MALKTKKRILAALMLWTFLWPLAHFALVKTNGVSAWKLGGWSMFCVPYKVVVHKIWTVPKKHFADYPDDWLRMYNLIRWARDMGWMRDPLPMMQSIYDRRRLEGPTKLVLLVLEVDLQDGGVFSTEHEFWFDRSGPSGKVQVTKRASWGREKMKEVPKAVIGRFRAAAGE